MDETGAYINNKLCWFWCLQCPRFCYVFADESRGIKALEGHEVVNRPVGLILYTDRHGTYFKLQVAGHQVCLVHLLRNLQYLNDLNPEQKWSSGIQELLRDAIHKSKTVPLDKIDKEYYKKKLSEALEENVAPYERKGANDFQALQNGLINCKDYIFTFLEHEEVSHHNNDTEIYMRGEEGALTSPPRLQMIHDELVKTGRKGWDGDTWEMQYQKALAFFNEKGLTKNFGTLDNRTRSLGDISFEHQGRRIQGMRMLNQGDIYAINGWEEHMYDNNSGVVDLHRNPKGNLETIARYTQPLYVAVTPRKQILKPNERVAVDFYIVNEKDLKGNHTLKMTMLTPAGKQIWTQQTPCQIKGGDVFGQLLSENMQLPSTSEVGMYRVEAQLLDTQGQEVTKGYDEVLVVNDQEALKGKGAIYAYKDDKIAAYYQKKTGKTLPSFTTKMGKLDWLVINRSLLDSPTLIDKKYFRNVKVTWFSDDDYRAKAGEEKDEWINRSFADGAQPASCLPANKAFSIRWEGELVPDESG